MVENLINIHIKPYVTMNDYVNTFLMALDTALDNLGMAFLIVGCARLPETQLNIIRNLALKHGIIKNDTPFQLHGITIFNAVEVPAWQPAWEALLDMGYLIAPIETVTIITGSRRGMIRNPSDHFVNALGQAKAVDFDSLLDSTDPDMYIQRQKERKQLYNLVNTLNENNPDLKIKQVLFEEKQECLHVGLF